MGDALLPARPSVMPISIIRRRRANVNQKALIVSLAARGAGAFTKLAGFVSPDERLVGVELPFRARVRKVAPVPIDLKPQANGRDGSLVEQLEGLTRAVPHLDGLDISQKRRR